MKEKSKQQKRFKVKLNLKQNRTKITIKKKLIQAKNFYTSFQANSQI